MKLRFILRCGDDPVTLGVEDAPGNWNMTAFKNHVRSCETCNSFIALLAQETLNPGEPHSKKAKGSLAAALAPPGAISRNSLLDSPSSKKKDQSNES